MLILTRQVRCTTLCTTSDARRLEHGWTTFAWAQRGDGAGPHLEVRARAPGAWSTGDDVRPGAKGGDGVGPHLARCGELRRRPLRSGRDAASPSRAAECTSDIKPSNRPINIRESRSVRS